MKGGRPPKLSADDVRLICELYASQPKRLTLRDIGEKFGVSAQCVSKVLNGQSYRTVKRSTLSVGPLLPEKIA